MSSWKIKLMKSTIEIYKTIIQPDDNDVQLEAVDACTVNYQPVSRDNNRRIIARFKLLMR